jgi:phosphoribosylanthranilate isomerase
VPELAASIESSAGVQRVGVFVNELRDRIEEIARIARLDIAQLHGDESPEDYPASIVVWKAARVRAGFDAAKYARCPAEALLLDGPANGQTFDWRVARSIELRIILTGGLDASNVAEAVAMVRPWGVDACSRVERSPGRKDHKKMIEFLQAARMALSL